MGDFSTCLSKAKAAQQTSSSSVVEFERSADASAYQRAKSTLQAFGAVVDNLTRAMYTDSPTTAEVRRRQQVVLELEDDLVTFEKRISRRPVSGTTKTLPQMSNQELQQFSQRLEPQEAMLDKLAESVGNLKQTGVSIGQELDLHMHLLTRIESGVEGNTTKMERLEARMMVLMESSSTCCLTFTILVLTLALLMIVVYL
jgi:hypothetical protein